MRKFITVISALILFINLQAQTSPFRNVVDSNFVFGMQYFSEGPDAPNVQISLQGSSIKLELSNSVTSNNYGEFFNLIDTSIHNGNQFFLFQGYIVYQALNNTINPFTNYFDTSKMRLVGQSDIADNVDTLTNHYLDTLTANCDSALMVQGGNLGVQYIYLMNTDAFTGNAFQQGGTFCYYVFAYAHNGNKLGLNCNKAFPFLISRRMDQGFSIQAQCITFNPTAINEYQNELKLSFYPNPTDNNVYVKLEETTQEVRVDITNIQGQNQFEGNYTNINNLVVKTIDFPSGIYFATVTSEKASKTFKFIKK